MILTTSGKIVKSILNYIEPKGFPTPLMREAHKKLIILHNAHLISDLKLPPGNKLEKLNGDRSGQYSIRINDKWRVCFEFRNGNAYDVEIIDYR